MIVATPSNWEQGGECPEQRGEDGADGDVQRESNADRGQPAGRQRRGMEDGLLGAC